MDSILQSRSVSKALTSDHYCVTCDLNVVVPFLSPVYRETRNLRSVDKSTQSAFCGQICLL